MTTFHPDGDLTFQLAQLLNQGLELGDNFRGATLEEDLVVGENTIQHGLGFIPTGFLVLYVGTRTTSEGSTALELFRRDDDFIEVQDATGTKIGGDFVGVRIDEWTTEILFLNASVESLGVRLFVL